MLMAFADLSANAAIWKSAGLKYIYYPDGLPANSAPPRLASPRVDENKKRFALPPSQARAAAAEKTASATPATEARKPAPWTFVSQDSMPDAWRRSLNKINKGSVAWTYMELGSDLISSSLELTEEEKKRFAARRGFIARILKDLGHPPGTHTFLPPAPGVWNASNFAADYFFSSLRILNCRGLLVFGSAVGGILFPEKRLRPLVSWTHGDLFVWVLRDINVLSEIDSPYYNESLAYLRDALRRFVRR